MVPQHAVAPPRAPRGNPRYLDKNYGGDAHRLGPPLRHLRGGARAGVYGTVKPLGSFNPVWAQVAYWQDLWRKSATVPRWIDWLRLWVMPPPWVPPGLAHEPDPVVEGRAKHETVLSPFVKWYVAAQLVPAVVATFLAMWHQTDAPRLALVAVVGLVFWTLISLGGLLDRRRWAVIAEVGRLAAVAVVAAAALG